MLRRLFLTIWIYLNDPEFWLLLWAIVLGAAVVLLFVATDQPSYSQTPVYR